MADELKKADEAKRVKTFDEIDAELRADPQCHYHDGDDDEDEHSLFFDDHVEHHKGRRVTRKRAIIRR